MKDVKNIYEEGILDSESEHEVCFKNPKDNVDSKNAPQLPLAEEYVEVVDIDAPPPQQIQELSKFKLFMNHIDEETEEESIEPFVPENPDDVPPPPSYLL